jgi:hypothetical protein
MSRHAPPVEADAIDQAIARVLAAEEAAQWSVARAATEAAQLREGARETARAIAQRTERRVRAVRARYEDRIASRVAALDGELPAPTRHVVDAEQTARLERALAFVAAELTGESPP